MLPGFASTIPRSTSCFSTPRRRRPTLSPACPSSNSFRNISTPVTTVFLSVPNPTISTSSCTFTFPRSIRPVATVPRPVIGNTSSTGIRNGFSTSRFGTGMFLSSAANSSSTFPTHALSPAIAFKADPRITGMSSPGYSYFDNSSRTSSSTRSNSSASSTRSHLFRNTTIAATFVRAAVNVVFPWSTCPMVPTFTWGFVRSNLAFAMSPPKIVVFPSTHLLYAFLSFHFRHNLFRLRFRNFSVVAELHAVYCAALAHRAQRGRVAKHLGQGHARGHDVRVGALRHAADLTAAGREIADDVAHVVGGRHVDDDVPVLAAAAGLADELALYVLDALAHRLAVGHLRSADVGVDLELPLHALDQHFQVQLAHPGDDRLRRLGVAMNAERRIFLGELLQRDGELVLVGLGLGLDSDRDHRLGELHRLEDDRVALVAQGVAGLRVLEPDSRGDVAGAHFVDLLALVGVHLQQPPDALPLVLRAVIDVRTRREDARIDPEERQLPDVRIGHDLERERGERLLVGGLAERVRGVVVWQGAPGGPN